MSHFLDSLLHRFDHDRSQRLRHITDTKGNDIRIRMRGFVRLLLLADFREQVCTLKIQIILIAMSHKFRLSILYYSCQYDCYILPYGGRKGK